MSSIITNNDQHWMREALRLAKSAESQADPNPHVGCVIVNNGEIVGSGATLSVGNAHAEVVALQEAGEKAIGATVYVTLEPCAHHGRTPPCVNALIKAKVAKVIIACEDPNPQVAGKGVQMLHSAGIETLLGFISEEAKELNRGFIKRMQTGMPFVTAKMGVSVDGRSAIATGDSNWISNANSRADAHEYRACMSAILSTAKTVLADDPRLTARKGDGYYERQPLRIILDQQSQVPASAKVFHQAGRSLLVVSSEKLGEANDNFSSNSQVDVISCDVVNGHFDLVALMKELGRREINNVLLEAGADFQGACIQSGVVDELRVYLAPILLGQSPFQTLQLPELSDMQARKKLKLMDIKRIDDDVRLTYHFIASD